jgi:hypothetical protein
MHTPQHRLIPLTIPYSRSHSHSMRPPATSTDIIAYNSAIAPHEKRWVSAVVVPIIAFLTRLGPLIARVGAGAARLKN